MGWGQIWRIEQKDKLKATNEQAEQKIEQIKEIANNYDNCNDVGHYVQDTDARHALEEVAQAMGDISQIIDKVEWWKTKKKL